MQVTFVKIFRVSRNVGASQKILTIAFEKKTCSRRKDISKNFGAFTLEKYLDM